MKRLILLLCLAPLYSGLLNGQQSVGESQWHHGEDTQDEVDGI
jgi:hypothetical protein